jgi:DNA-binding GntR family transcriptional regulator
MVTSVRSAVAVDGDAVLSRSPFSTMQDMIVNKLREAILKGHLKPGERIFERSITEQMGLSKTPVREALTHLEAEGWVQIIPYRGAVVAPLSVEELEDIYVIRISIEGTGARLAARNITAETLKELNDLVAQMVKTRDEESLMALNRHFHEVFYRQCGRKLLSNLISQFQDKSVRYRRLLQGFSGTRRRIITERRALLSACAQHSPSMVERLVQQNLSSNLERLRGYIADLKGNEVSELPKNRP